MQSKWIARAKIEPLFRGLPVEKAPICYFRVTVVKLATPLRNTQLRGQPLDHPETGVLFAQQLPLGEETLQNRIDP